MKNKMTKIFAMSVLLMQLVGCGANQDNLEILNSTNIPSLGTFFSSGSFSVNSQYSSSAPYWILSSGSYGSYLSPARGVIAEIGTSSVIPGTSYVTIIHSGRVATRVHGISGLLGVRSGDVIVAGGTVASFFTTTTVAFQVLLDGTSVCPLSYMDATVLSSIFNSNLQLCR